MTDVKRLTPDAPAPSNGLALSSSVPEPLRGLLIDALTAAVVIVAAVVARIGIEHVAVGVIPFVLTFPAALVATLWRGARAGTAAAVGCQLLTIRYVFPHWTVDHGGEPAELANLVLSTLSLAGMIWAAARFRSVSLLFRRRCSMEVETLSLVISEMDHRTKNNFQIASTMLADQARRTGSEAASRELVGASDRLAAIASVYRNLGLSQDRSSTVDLRDYLTDIVDNLRSGVVPADVEISVSGAATVMSSQRAMIVGLIVNEWIANAVKYAFSGRGGSIRVTIAHAGDGMIVTVADNGGGGGGGVGVGTQAGGGSWLMPALAATIDARIDVQRTSGTTCTLHVDRR